MARPLPEPLNRQDARNTYECGIDEKQDDREHRVSLAWFTHRLAPSPDKVSGEHVNGPPANRDYVSGGDDVEGVLSVEPAQHASPPSSKGNARQHREQTAARLRCPSPSFAVVKDDVPRYLNFAQS